jgi:hypothetical protein
MRKLVGLTLFALLAAIFVSCTRNMSDQAEGTPEPGINMGNITVEKHSPDPSIPDLAKYCSDYENFGKEAGTQTFECEVPLIPRLQIYFGWGAKDTTVLGSNWSAMTWELYIDEYQINLDEFEQWNESGPDFAGHLVNGRGWVIDLVNLSPGKHTLRVLWKSETPIDDGFDIYAPGKHENIVNLTVLEKQART